MIWNVTWNDAWDVAWDATWNTSVIGKTGDEDFNGSDTTDDRFNLDKRQQSPLLYSCHQHSMWLPKSKDQNPVPLFLVH
jgi:hypothetical protein